MNWKAATLDQVEQLCRERQRIGTGVTVSPAWLLALIQENERLRDNTRLVLDGIQMLCQGEKFDNLSELARQSVTVQAVSRSCEHLRRLDATEAQQAEGTDEH
jgi:formylmethanofuran dehydrogenase subunit E-like metal-binding protein